MMHAVYTYVVAAIVFVMNNVVVTDEKPYVDVSLDRAQITQIARAIDKGDKIVIEATNAKLRSCGNNVSGVNLLIFGYHTHIIDFGNPSFNQKAVDFEVDITDQLRMVRPLSPLWDGKLKVKVNPIFTDSNVKGCFSINARKVEVRIKTRKKEPLVFNSSMAVFQTAGKGANPLWLSNSPIPPKPRVIEVQKPEVTEIPVLHSNPGAKASIYLDFDGHYEKTWGQGVYKNLNTPKFSRYDLIEAIWKRVSEDYAPFNIDVTTELPKETGHGKMVRVAIGGSCNDWFKCQAGGVAMVGSFANSYNPNVVYIFADTLYNNSKTVAEASSHEAGHSFGLQHQRTFDRWGRVTREYNPGNSKWSPIMGYSYQNENTTWSNGQSSSMWTYQDDMGIIANKVNGFGYKDDDYPSSIETAQPITNNEVKGLIFHHTDKDVFLYKSKGGLHTVEIKTPEIGPNLDAVLEVWNGSEMIASCNPEDSLNCSMKIELPEGTYFFVVANTGEYGKVGSYTLTVK